MRVLPVTTLALRSEVVEHAALVEVVVEEELGGRWRLLPMHRRHDWLRWARSLRRPTHRVGEGRPCHGVGRAIIIIVEIEQPRTELLLLACVKLARIYVDLGLESKVRRVDLLEA